jgi:hypothetical protein
MFDIFTTTATNFKNDMDNLLVELKPFEVTYQLDGKVMSLIFKTKKEMALTMMRFAEFYESPLAIIKNKCFTYSDLLEYYADDDGYFNYMNYYEGYNIPVDIMFKFASKFFKQMTDREQDVLIAVGNTKCKYLIATLEGDTNTLDHELSHARWSLQPEYKKEMLGIIHSLPQDIYDAMRVDLSTNYDLDVLDDEICAYMLTGTLEELVDTFPSLTTEEIKSFQEWFV